MHGVPRAERIVCLTAETTEIAFRLGCADRVVGVSGYTVRPPEARLKPRVAAFQTAHVERILALKPDLVLGFSDLQSEIIRELVKRGAQVLVTNQRTLSETYQAIMLISGALGEPEGGLRLVEDLRGGLADIANAVDPSRRRPRVYFEEWDAPLITGIAWVSELITICGGNDVMADLSPGVIASERVVAPEAVIAADPEIIVASWCGKKARLERIARRPGFDVINAVRTGRLFEIRAPDILQPGPSLIHGAQQLAGFLKAMPS